MPAKKSQTDKGKSLLAVRIPKELHNALWDLAGENRRPLGWQVQIVLEIGLQQINKEKKG